MLKHKVIEIAWKCLKEIIEKASYENDWNRYSKSINDLMSKFYKGNVMENKYWSEP